MYLNHFNLNHEPFKQTADAGCFYACRKHQDVLSCLEYTIEYRKGFGILIGDPGSGKTTLVRVLLENLDPAARVAVISNTHLDDRELLYMILTEFGQEIEDKEKCSLLNQLNDFLTKETYRGRTPILVIDEAHNLSPRVLEEVRMLANLEAESEKLLQVILVGQPRLKDMIGNEGLSQLEQRIPFGVRLDNLDLNETREYIRFRLRAAGAVHDGIFTEDAMEVIYFDSGGVPRIINNLCDACMVSAYATGKQHIDSAMARETIEERTRLFAAKTILPSLDSQAGERRVANAIANDARTPRHDDIRSRSIGTRSDGGARNRRKTKAEFVLPSRTTGVGRVLRIRPVLNQGRSLLLSQRASQAGLVGEREEGIGLRSVSSIETKKKPVCPVKKKGSARHENMESLESRFYDLIKTHPHSVLIDCDPGDVLFADCVEDSSNGGEH